MSSHHPRHPPNDHYGPSSNGGYHREEPSRSKVVVQPKDENLPPNTQSDPRGDDPSQRITKKANKRGAGRNTESFDPASTLVRPHARVLVGNPHHEKYNKPLKHDDVVVVPELFGPEDNWDIYYELVQELTKLQQSNVKGSEFISWHEGAHLICKSPQQSPKFQEILARLCQYFDIDPKTAGTRFNWYKDSSDWKPFHHDSAAFNPTRAKNQNITVGVSFGATRELAFIKANSTDPIRLYFPQTNNGVFTFGRDVNIQWKHGVNALPEAEQDGKGRISIVLWGNARNVVEEEGSPPLLGADGQGPHANHNRDNNKRGRRGDRRDHHSRGRDQYDSRGGDPYRGRGGDGLPPLGFDGRAPPAYHNNNRDNKRGRRHSRERHHSGGDQYRGGNGRGGYDNQYRGDSRGGSARR